MSKLNSQIAILFITFCAGVLGTVRGGCPVSGGDGRRGEGGSSPVQGRDARIGTQKHVWDFYNIFLFQSLRALGSATSQRPEQSADQVHEGAGGEGGGGGGAEEQRGGQQQPRPRAGPVQAAGALGLH